MNVAPINKLTPCVVKSAALSGYSQVMPYPEAKELAMSCAAKGFSAEVFRADVSVDSYGGYGGPR